MTYVLVYNPSDGPVVIDVDGRVLGSREWGPADSTDDTAKALLASDQLVKVDKPAKDANPDAVAAAQETVRLNERGNALHATGNKDALTAAAREAGLIGDADTPPIGDLVRVLARTDIPVPTSEPAAPAPKEK